ncbi:MAG TPA: tetratricopeptide repeat protein [Methylomirabilota bacterium]|jgi:TolA-binding protein|nr:tetratricopeptide repeat protein [Methylomirabilota bacterium]
MRSSVCLVGVLAWAMAGTAPALAAVSEADRLWTVGIQAFEDGLYDVSYRELAEFARVAPNDARRGDAAVVRGKAAFALGRYGDALGEFGAAQGMPLRAFTPGEPLFWQAEVLFRLRRFSDARERYTLFVRGYPTSPYADDALYARGFSELELGLPEEALATFNTLLREYPASELAGSAAYAAARELVRAKRWDEALGLLSAYPSRFPQSRFLPEARYLLGVTQVETGRAAEGARSLEEFVTAHPTHDLAPTARVLLAESHLKAGRTPEAIEQYRGLVKHTPTSSLVPQALYQIGDLSQRLGRTTDAETAWKTLRRDYPQDALAASAGLELANLHLKGRQFDQAMQAAREVADAKGPQRLDALLLLGEGALKAGKMAEARGAYEAVLAEAPVSGGDRFRALAGVGLVAESQKETEAARRAYQEIAEKADDAELVRWAKSRLQGLEARDKPTPRVAPKAKPRPSAKPESGS